MSFEADSDVTAHNTRVAGLARPSIGLYRMAFKRLIDVLVVLVCSIPILVVIAILALIVALKEGKPLYRQPRIGRDGHIFMMWKLRTMVLNAETALETHLAGCDRCRAEWDETQKLKDDPRITRFGRILRMSSLDELPQLWNVLKGDMSLVGPRPMMPDQSGLYPGQAYYRMRPGITGPWQVSERNESSFAARAAFDTQYERDMSLTTDIGLIMATFRVVMRATGY